MNERIRELAEQAGFQYINDEGIGWAGNHNASLPKFAELIVRECAAIALREDHDPADCILAHFGLLNTAKPQRQGPLDSSYPDGDGYWK